MREEIKRILKTIEYYHSDGREHKGCPVCGINPVKLEEELERIRDEAKEEAYANVAQEIGAILSYDPSECEKRLIDLYEYLTSKGEKK